MNTIRTASSHELDLPLRSQTTLANADLGNLCIYTSKLDCLAVGQSVHRRLGNVEASVCMVNAEDKDALCLVGDLIACTTLCRVPSCNVDTAADEREAWDLSLGCPSVA